MSHNSNGIDWNKYKNEILDLHSQGKGSSAIVDILEDSYGKFPSKNPSRQIRKIIARANPNELRVESKTSPNDYGAPFVLSAWDKNGKIMNIEEYCTYHGLPRKDITSYKLITHSKQPYFNCVFREVATDVEDLDFKGAVNDALSSLGFYEAGIIPPKIEKETDITRLIYTDVHIAMSTNIEGTAMYATKWDYDTIMETCNTMCDHVIANRNGTTLVIDELGDFLDGWDGFTTRGGHKLPQNMTNTIAFQTGLEFKLQMMERLTPYFKTIICNNICNDNHSGDFSSILNHSFKVISEDKYGVTINNHVKFINHYFLGKHGIVICHGKDKKALKFGFKPKLDAVQIEKIDHYMKHNGENIYRKSEWIEFSKGDSHQMLFDYSTAQDFDYCNYPALSPASEWVQTGFKKGIRGFVIQLFNTEERTKTTTPILL